MWVLLGPWCDLRFLVFTQNEEWERHGELDDQALHTTARNMMVKVCIAGKTLVGGGLWRGEVLGGSKAATTAVDQPPRSGGGE